MSLSNEEIIEAIASKSLMEIMDLVKAMEDKFGVSAAAPVAVAAAARAGDELVRPRSLHLDPLPPRHGGLRRRPRAWSA